MRSLLITGASGFLGGHLCHQTKVGWQLWGTYHTQAIAPVNINPLPLDLTDEQSVQSVWEQARPDAVIHTAALAATGQCQQNPTLSYQVNVAGTAKLVRRCAAAQIPFIFTSTDLVFDGTCPPYAEGDRPNPVNIYGAHKAIAEATVLATYPAATICRLPLLMGPPTATAQCFVQSTLAAIAANIPQTLFTDEIRTPASVFDIIQALHLILDQAVSGIWHLGGPQPINRYELGCLIAKTFELPTTTLQPALQASVSLSTPRPPDVALDSHKAFALGYTPKPPQAALKAIAQASSSKEN
ncbi:SDR family oxidoreductase [Leptolyngbya iicbica]|uniref:dTDP-4-dehydrorhamnose reductase n=2 Tax=Cyanophyceae TaxID=3028117 RepID=A0A4Q7E2L9_9CYAN|nr:SDR family oxidoreductase [Leptolyngbya sp. LK]RZM76022.1 SDR family oxidoreductase [Leptolyngbya sp. LK]